MSCTDLFQIDATIVANEFIDKYMPQANGDYVKVYLYLLKNGSQGIDLATIAEALNLTEGDVMRAVKYWEKQGILSLGHPEADAQKEAENPALATVRRERIRKYSEELKQASEKERPEASGAGEVSKASAAERTEAAEEAIPSIPEKAAEKSAKSAQEAEQEELRSHYRRTEGKEILNRLSRDAEFAQLLLIVQKYRAKLLTESEEQVLAYLYDGLHLSSELIDYLVAYCVESGHNNMRYIEKTGLNWATIGIRDVSAARRRTQEFDRIASEKKTKTSVKTAKQGITRNADLDDWVKTQLLEKI